MLIQALFSRCDLMPIFVHTRSTLKIGWNETKTSTLLSSDE